MDGPTITVFGGTGFLGRRVVAALARRGCAVRAASRHPDPAGPADGIRPVLADVRDERSVAAALDGADGAVNAVSLYEESGGTGFAEIHVEGARRVAETARATGLRRLVHLSGIGADASSPSAYVRARGQGEQAVRAAFPGTSVFRPGAMFGDDDPLLSTLLQVTRLPVIPLFGRGTVRLQPVAVEDVAEAAARVLVETADPAPVYELGGPRIYTYRELLGAVLRATGRRRALVPVPFAAWRALAAAGRLLPAAPVNEGQVALMRRDNVADPRLPGLAALGIEPRTLEAALQRRLRGGAAGR